MKTVIIGGGISGLAAAYYLSRHQPSNQVVLLESSSRLGGIIRTEQQEGFCLEAGPDAFVRQKKKAAELCRELGLGSELIANRIANQVSYSWLDGKLHPLPRVLNPPIDLDQLVASPLLSPSGRLRASREPEIPPGGGVDESVASFMGRRFGPEVVQRVFEPLVAGVFGGSASEISLPAAFPHLLDFEQQHGCLSLPGTESASPSGTKAEESSFQSLRNGMGQLPAKLAQVLQEVVQLHLGSSVRSIGRDGGRFRIELESGASLQTDSAVLATSAPVAASLLEGDLKPISDLLGQIEYAPSILVCLGYRQEVVDRPGSGWIAPPDSGKALLACTWAHRKFDHRCPTGHSLLRAYLAGRSASSLLEADDRPIVRIVRQELREIQGVTAHPVVQRVYRLPRALPLYKIGHLDLVSRIKQSLRQTPGLFCIGNYLDGVGIPACLRHAQSVAAQGDPHRPSHSSKSP